MYTMTINSMSVDDTMTRFDETDETETCIHDGLRGDEDETRDGTQGCTYTQMECLAGLVDISVILTFNGIPEAASHGLVVEAPASGQTRSLAVTQAHFQNACMLVEQDLKEMASINTEGNTIEAGTSMAYEKVSKGSFPAAGDTSSLAPAADTARLPLTTTHSLTAENLAFAHWHASTSPQHNQLLQCALEGFGIDLSTPPFTDLLPRLEGLKPMTRFEREG